MRSEAKYWEVEAFFYVDFWDCIEGEEMSGNMCTLCDKGFYSLVAGANTCLPCILNADCDGGNHIIVH